MTLLIMAAGIGSRFGGLKQLEPIGPNGEFIIDYSIYDAIKAGFNKIVFIIKKENYDEFRNTIGKRVEGIIPVSYVFQDFSNVPSEYSISDTRIKPLGTGHAVLCAKNKVTDKFAVITADDFYGRDAFVTLSKFLNTVDDVDSKYAAICYDVAKTINSTNSVKRGLCYIKDSYITDIIESKIEVDDNKFIAYPLNGNDSFNVTSEIKATMAIFALTPKIFEFFDEDFKMFLNENKNNLDTAEYMLTDIIDKIIKNKIGRFIAENRKKKNMTQQDLANLLNVGSKTISRWETGKYMPDLSMLIPLSDEIGVSVHELLLGEYIEEKEITMKTKESMETIVTLSNKQKKKDLKKQK